MVLRKGRLVLIARMDSADNASTCAGNNRDIQKKEKEKRVNVGSRSQEVVAAGSAADGCGRWLLVTRDKSAAPLYITLELTPHRPIHSFFF